MIGSFQRRHIGPGEHEVKQMLSQIQCDNLDELVQNIIPENILRDQDTLQVGQAMTEQEYLLHANHLAAKNQLTDSFIGQGYYGTITPSPIQRNILENPGWYTQYTPYQAEISQGRLEALLNFQTVVTDLTGLPIANASLLDESTAAAEAMTMLHAKKNKRRKTHPANRIYVDRWVFQQTIDVLRSRAEPLGIEVVVENCADFVLDETVFAVLLQYPNAIGEVIDYKTLVDQAKDLDISTIVAADILSLALLQPPGEWGAEVVVGSTQRLGIPIGYGGPHAAYFSTTEDNKRLIPGRIIGVSIDRFGDPAYRMALQTREQHIKREKATSNICTAQALLAIMAGMYAVYHGPEGIKEIAHSIHDKAIRFAKYLGNHGYQLQTSQFFDTVTIVLDRNQINELKEKAVAANIELFWREQSVSISFDEGHRNEQIEKLQQLFQQSVGVPIEVLTPSIQSRESDFLSHEIFHKYRSETSLMRYIKSLESKDLSLVHSMIPLGSCTMKLNSSTQLMPISWAKINQPHPFSSPSANEGYRLMIEELASDLCKITGFSACSFQPNSGAQGEYAGLMTIRQYHLANGDEDRKMMLIPSSAHGTNPASAIMAGMRVIVVRCDDQGDVDLEDLQVKIEKAGDQLAGLMITYPSTHGVFEANIVKVCELIHEGGGLVYMDGANMNAQVGLTNPAVIGADVCHLNLHKTFAIPHGGGGPGMGPICVNDKLKEFLPGHFTWEGQGQGIHPVAAAPYGSASILWISYAYIKLLGDEGLKRSSQIAMLNSNYIRERLDDHYEILYVGKHGFVAHELILDLRSYKKVGVSAEDVAKRLIDYGFHAPTLSFPVPGTLMIEPTESENKEELDRFCAAMIAIKDEINEVALGKYPADDNVLVNAPHTMREMTADEWQHAYTRQKAAFPLEYLLHNKFWSSVARVDNAYGDRNLICTCPPIESYEVAD